MVRMCRLHSLVGRVQWRDSTEENYDTGEDSDYYDLAGQNNDLEDELDADAINTAAAGGASDMVRIGDDDLDDDNDDDDDEDANDDGDSDGVRDVEDQDVLAFSDCADTFPIFRTLQDDLDELRDYAAELEAKVDERRPPPSAYSRTASSGYLPTSQNFASHIFPLSVAPPLKCRTLLQRRFEESLRELEAGLDSRRAELRARAGA
ncbi:hypothetical protein HK405_009496 [Cladochytrium tenue]|nr:hypothetical protein HK405_009496 [Cladochytrium tenue]